MKASLKKYAASLQKTNAMTPMAGAGCARRKPNGITKADRNARKLDDLLKRDFRTEKPLEKCVTDIAEIPAQDGKLYVSAIFDCYDLVLLGLAMADNRKAGLCVDTVKNAYQAFPSLRGAIIHSDCGSQYTSASYRAKFGRCGIVQSINSDGADAMTMHAVRQCGPE